MTLGERMTGVFLEPEKTFRSLAEQPVWTDVLIVTLIAFAVYTAVIMPFASREAFSHFQVEGSETPDWSRMPKWLLIIPVVFGLISTAALIFLSSGLIHLLGRLFSPHGDFKAVLAVYLHAGLADALAGNAVRLTVALTKKTALVLTNPALFFPDIPPRSFLFAAMAPFDFFRLAVFILLGVGLAPVLKIEKTKAFIVAFLAWFVLSALAVGLASLGLALSRR